MIGAWLGQVGSPTSTRARGLAARDELEAQPQRAASARRLYARDALVAGMLAKQDRGSSSAKRLSPSPPR